MDRPKTKHVTALVPPMDKRRFGSGLRQLAWLFSGCTLLVAAEPLAAAEGGLFVFAEDVPAAPAGPRPAPGNGKAARQPSPQNGERSGEQAPPKHSPRPRGCPYREGPINLLV